MRGGLRAVIALGWGVDHASIDGRVTGFARAPVVVLMVAGRGKRRWRWCEAGKSFFWISRKYAAGRLRRVRNLVVTQGHRKVGFPPPAERIAPQRRGGRGEERGEKLVKSAHPLPPPSEEGIHTYREDIAIALGRYPASVDKLSPGG